MTGRAYSEPLSIIREESADMGAELRLRLVGSIRDGASDKGRPAWYEVDGLPEGHLVLIESTGNPKNLWRIKRVSPQEQAHSQTYATPEEALAALQKEVDTK